MRRSLLAQRESLLAAAQAGRDAAATVELDQSRVGRLSRMDALQGQAMSRAGEARRQTELRRIQAALARIDSGDFGDCTACGEPIALARLRFNPAVALCVDCAAAGEAGA